jgi:hypothetical protein
MDSSIQSCETNKNFKPKFNATSNTKPRRYNKMMCSSWKISVFGIVALMLAFGLATPDALAVKTGVTVAHDQAAGVRAGTTETIEFTVTLDSTASTGGDDVAGTVTITIPSVWSRPINSDDETSGAPADANPLEVGEVFVEGEADNFTATVRGRSLVVSAGKDIVGDEITFHFRTVVPGRAAVYTFPVSAPAYTGASNLQIAVGPVEAGAGDLTLSPLKALPKTDPVTPYQEEYVINSEQVLGTLTVRFVAVGTMPAGSTIILTSTGFPVFTHAQDDTEVAVSGHVENIDRQERSVTVAVKAGGIQKGAAVVFTIKNYKAAKIAGDGVSANAIEWDDATNGHSIRVHTSIAGLTVNSTVFAADTTAASGDPQFRFVVTKPHGTGKVVLSHNDTTPAVLSYIAADAAIPGSGLQFTFTELAGIGQGAKFEITIPEPWPLPFVAIGGTASTANGTLTADPDTHGVTVEGRTIKGNFLSVDDPGTTPPTAPTILYRVDKAPAAVGAYTFPSKASSSHSGPPAPMASPTLEVTGGKGSVALMQGGRAFTQTTDKAEVGTLTFVYTAGSRVAKDASVTIAQPTTGSWTAFREDNGDGTADPGEVTLSGKANLTVTANLLTATLSDLMTAGERLVFTYKKVTVRDIPDGTTASDTFQAQANLYSGEALADIPSPNVGIGRAPDGAGSLSLSVTQADAGSAIGNLAITYRAAGHMEAGSTVEVTVPANGDWPDATETGRVTLSAGTLSTTATTMTATTDSVMDSGDIIVFTYNNITAPSAGGTYTFTAKSTSSGGGTLTALASGATITIDEVAVGSAMITGADGMLTSAAPGMALGNLSITFTAGAQMASGAQVQVTVPVGWTPPFNDNNDGVDAAGEVSLAGAANLAVSGGGGTPWVLTATTNAVLETGNSLVITYKMVTAPAAEATYVFTTKSSLSSAAALLPIKNPPRVIVRTPVTALAVHAMPESVFTGEDITVTADLWSAGGELAKALGPVVVMLSDGEAGGTFSDADGNAVTSVTIADNTSSASATYNNSAAGMVTITATSGEMTDTAAVEIKSTIRDLSVNGETEMVLTTQGGSIMVRATGPVGGGTVTVLDSDGQKVGLKKALDPVGEPDADGDQVYARSVELPDVVADGMYTVSVEIQGDVNNSLMIEVVNDQTPPVVSNANASEAVVVNGDTLTISADVAMNESMVEITSVVADLGGLDSTQESVMLDELSSSPGKYFTIITVNADNEAEDGEYTITITATDAIGNTGMDTTMVTLENDPSELHTAEVDPGSAKPGETIWIKATGSAGGDAMATVNNAGTGMMIAQVTLDEDAMTAGSYSAGLMIVEDAHPAGVYDVTVTLGTQSMTREGALTIEPPGYDFTLTIGAGTHLIHVPLAVTKVNGADMTIATVRDLYNALGDAVSIIISLGADGSWNSYLGDDAPGMAFGDMMLDDATGLVAVMNSAVTLELTGNALGTGGVSTIKLNAGNNLVGVPLDSAQISMISDVLGALVSAVVVSNEAGDGFQTITQAGDPGDGPLMGGEGYIVVAAAAASIPVIGSPWQNMDGASTAPPVASGANVKTPVLHVRGQLVDEAGMMTLDGLTVSVRNVTNGSVLGSSVATDEYSMTFVKLNSSAAKVGDILEIKADSGNPLLGIRPVQHVVTAEDVLNGSISLPDLVTYEIPAQSELLANYPNPFNPETWIPFRLAEDSNVSLDIYGASGALVRTIDLGFTPAAVYEGRSDAIYWDGRNNFGEQVSSGLYFYHLRAGEFSATRRMVVVK